MSTHGNKINIWTGRVSELAIENLLALDPQSRVTGKQLVELFRRQAMSSFNERELGGMSDQGMAIVMGKAMRRAGYKASLINGRSVYRGLAIRDA